MAGFDGTYQWSEVKVFVNGVELEGLTDWRTGDPHNQTMGPVTKDHVISMVNKEAGLFLEAGDVGFYHNIKAVLTKQPQTFAELKDQLLYTPKRLALYLAGLVRMGLIVRVHGKGWAL